MSGSIAYKLHLFKVTHKMESLSLAKNKPNLLCYKRALFWPAHQLCSFAPQCGCLCWIPTPIHYNAKNAASILPPILVRTLTLQKCRIRASSKRFSFDNKQIEIIYEQLSLNGNLPLPLTIFNILYRKQICFMTQLKPPQTLSSDSHFLFFYEGINMWFTFRKLTQTHCTI